MAKDRAYYIINGITVYRLIASPVLMVLIFTGKEELFKWLLALSFFTDFIDGFLAREFKVASVFGSRLDSVADDLTIVAAITGLFVLKFDFVKTQWGIIIPLLALYLFQTALALYRYKKISSFHTYAAKCAAILQGFFLVLIFFLPQPLYLLFYGMSAVTALELIEEIILVLHLPRWQANVKGLYWVMKKEKKK